MISPNVPDSTENILTAISVVSNKDVWAVGYYLNVDKSYGKTLTMHWDGNKWSIVPSPNINSSYGRYNYLTDVAAISANDVWAVGDYDYYEGQGYFGHATYIIHWDGKAWSEVRSPNVGQSANVLRAVAFTSKDDVWAVGYYSNASPTYSTLTLHWDGKLWSVVPSPTIPDPNPGLTANKLVDVVALGKNDIWSLGEYMGYSMLQHWDGARWNVVVPGSRSIGAQLTSLAAFGPNDIWALGPRLAVAHWDGSTWDEVRKPDYYGLATGIEKALALPSGEILTLGNGSGGHILIGHLLADGGSCNASEIRLNAPPTPIYPTPVPTNVP